MELSQQGYLSFPQKTFVGRLKSSAFWRLFVLAASPGFHFVWAYVVNFREKALYLFSPYRGPMRPVLREKSLEIVKGDPWLTRFANELRESIPPALLEEYRRELLANPSPEAFVASIQEKLPLPVRINLLRFALSEEQLKNVLPYFGLVPRLNSIQVMFNIVRPELREEGSKLWHFDDGYYKSLNLFLCVTDLTDENGPYSAVGTQACPLHANIPLDSIDRRLSNWVNQRHSDELLQRYVRKDQIEKMTGPAGTAAWVDSGAVYHKGGHCKSAERIMVQIHYSTELNSPQESVLKQLGLQSNQEALTLVNSSVKRYMTFGSQESRANRLAMKLKNPMYLIGRRILCYYLRPLKKA